MWYPELGLISGNLFGTGSNPDTPQALRQKIALAMLMQKRKAPSNLGEGLSAIGDSLGDLGMMRRIEGEAAAGEQSATAAESRILGTPQAAASTSPPPVQAAAVAAQSNPNLYTPDRDPRDPTAVQGNVQEGGGRTGTLFRPNIQTANVQPTLPPARPAQPIPAGQQQADDASGLYRMPEKEAVDDWRAQNPLPQNIPPPGAGAPRGLAAAPPVGGRPSVADYGQKLALAPTPQPPPQPAADALAFPPVVAMGGEPRPDDPRREAAVSLLRQQMGGQTRSATPPAPAAALPPDQGIRPAPSTPPQAAAPPQNLPDPGYITPLPPTRKPPPLTTPIMQSIEQEIRAASPSVRESVQTKLMPLYEKEKGALAQAHEAYKDGLIQDRALELKHHEQKAAARASVDASNTATLTQEEARQRIDKAKIPEVKQDIDTGLTYNPATKQWETPKIAGAGPDTKPTFKGNEFQGKALVNYGRARIAQEGLQVKPKGSEESSEELLANSPLQSALSATLPGIGGRPASSFRSDAYKEAETHADNFVQAFIRQQSGGAYGPAELEAEARGMLPKYGDTKEQLQTKREQREQFLSGMYSIIGPSGQKGAEYDATKREAERAKTTGPDPLENREILMPDKTIRVRRDGKWVPK